MADYKWLTVWHIGSECETGFFVDPEGVIRSGGKVFTRQEVEESLQAEIDDATEQKRRVLAELDEIMRDRSSH